MIALWVPRVLGILAFQGKSVELSGPSPSGTRIPHTFHQLKLRSTVSLSSESHIFSPPKLGLKNAGWGRGDGSRSKRSSCQAYNPTVNSADSYRLASERHMHAVACVSTDPQTRRK